MRVLVEVGAEELRRSLLLFLHQILDAFVAESFAAATQLDQSPAVIRADHALLLLFHGGLIL